MLGNHNQFLHLPVKAPHSIARGEQVRIGSRTRDLGHFSLKAHKGLHRITARLVRNRAADLTPQLVGHCVEDREIASDSLQPHGLGQRELMGFIVGIELVLQGAGLDAHITCQRRNAAWMRLSRQVRGIDDIHAARNVELPPRFDIARLDSN